MWKFQVAAVSFFALAACAPSTEMPPSVLPAEAATEVPATPAKLMTWDDLTSRPPVAPSHQIRWGEGPTDIIDLWLPEGGGPRRHTG